MIANIEKAINDSYLDIEKFDEYYDILDYTPEYDADYYIDYSDILKHPDYYRYC